MNVSLNYHLKTPLRVNLENAVSRGNANLLKFLHTCGCPLDDSLLEIAIKNNKIECVKYIHQNEIELTDDYLHLACLNADIECIKYIYQNKQNCRFRNNSLEFFISNNINNDNLLNLVQYMIEIGAPVSQYALFNCMKDKTLETFKYLYNLYPEYRESCFNKLIQYGGRSKNNPLILDFLIEKECSFSQQVLHHLDITYSISMKLINYILNYLEKHNPEWLKQMKTYIYLMFLAAKTGNLELLKLLHKLNFEYCPSILNIAAKHYHFDCVKYMLINDFKYEKRILLKKLNYAYDRIDIDDIEWRKILFSLEEKCGRFPNLCSMIQKKKKELEEIKKMFDEILVNNNLICEDVVNYCIKKYV